MCRLAGVGYALEAVVGGNGFVCKLPSEKEQGFGWFWFNTKSLTKTNKNIQKHGFWGKRKACSPPKMLCLKNKVW